MNLRFVVRGYRRRWLVSTLAVLALGIALATSLASWRMGAVLSSGKPRGTSLGTQPFSLFQYSRDSRLHFFLSPRQIRDLELDLAGSAQVIGASGLRATEWDHSGTARPIHVDFVSPNFFSALSVQFLEGQPQSFATTEDGVVLSETFLRDYGLKTAPEQIRIAGRRMQVVGVAREFSGLFDNQTHAWIHWAQAPGILYPITKIEGREEVDDQMWFFWALAIPKPSEVTRFRALLKGAVDRAAQVAPPFDRLVALPGITNQTDLRAEADKSQQLYGTVSLLLLSIAILAMGLLVALIRLSRLSNEWTMLRLGAPRLSVLAMPFLYGFMPILASAILAIVCVPWLDRTLLLDPSISALMTRSADFSGSPFWKEFAWVLLIAGAVCVLFNALVMRGAGLHFGAVQLRTQSQNLDRIFSVFNALIAAAAVFTLAISALAAYESLNKSSAIAAASVQNVWFQEINIAKDGTPLTSEQRRQLQVQLESLVPSASASGFVTLRPLSGAKMALSEYSAENGQVRMMLNPSSPDAIAAMGQRLMAGRMFTAGAENELVVDEDAARQIQALVAPMPLLGAEIRDDVGDKAIVVGVVSNVSYTTDMGQAPPIAYQAMPSEQKRFLLVMRGALNEADLERLRTRGPSDAFQLKYGEPEQFSAVADQLRSRYRARSMLTIITSVLALVVAALLLTCAGMLRAQRKTHNYAVRVALGAPSHRIVSHFLKAEVGSNLVGGMAAIALILILKIPEKLAIAVVLSTQILVASLSLAVFVATTLVVLFLVIRPLLSTKLLIEKLQVGTD